MAVNEKWILSNNWRWPAQWLNQEEVLKHFPKPNLHQKKVIVTVRWCAASLIHYSFLNPSEVINSEKYAHKSMRYTGNANAWSQHWSVEWFHFSTTTPYHTSHKQCFKSWMNWATKFCLIHHIHLTSLSPTDWHFFKHLKAFCRENASTTSKRQKTLSKSSSNPDAQILKVMYLFYMFWDKQFDSLL